MVTLELRDHERFFSRTSSGKYPLDVSELRAAFMLSENMAERITKFRMDRISNILSGETPVPMDNNPKIILHIIPFTAFDPTKILPTSFLKAAERKIHPVFFLDLSNIRYNFDGFLAYAGDTTLPSSGYLQLFRNGIIEVVGTAATKGDRPNDNAIPALDFEEQLHNKLPEYISAQKDMGLSPPFLVTMSLLGAHNCTIYVPRFHPLPDQKIDRDILLLPDSIIEEFEFNLDVMLKQIVDTLWNAAGFEGSPHFDPSSGRWKEYSSN